MRLCPSTIVAGRSGSRDYLCDGSKTTDELTVLLFQLCDIHIVKGVTLNLQLLHCLLRDICGCRAVQTNSAETHCIISYCHNIISSCRLAPNCINSLNALVNYTHLTCIWVGAKNRLRFQLHMSVVGRCVALRAVSFSGLHSGRSLICCTAD